MVIVSLIVLNFSVLTEIVCRGPPGAVGNCKPVSSTGADGNRKVVSSTGAVDRETSSRKKQF